MACACSTRTCHWLDSVRDAPGLKCQGSARSVPSMVPGIRPSERVRGRVSMEPARPILERDEARSISSGIMRLRTPPQFMKNPHPVFSCTYELRFHSIHSISFVLMRLHTPGGGGYAGAKNERMAALRLGSLRPL